MDTVKRNSFWFGVGGFVAVVVIAGVILVGGKKGESSDLEASILGNDGKLQAFADRDQDGKLEADTWPGAAEQHVQSLESTRNEVKAYLTGEGGKILGSWFPKFKQAPSIDEFKREYHTQTDNLKQALEDKGVRVGPPKKGAGGTGGPFGRSTGEENGFEKIDEPTAANMVGLQKHYWIQKRLVDVLVESGTLALLNVKFLDQVGASGGVMSGPGGTPPGMPTARAASSNPKLPLDLGEVIEFEIVVESFYPDIPKLASNFLKVDKTLPLFTRVKKLEIKRTKVPPEKEERKITPAEADDPNRVKPEPDRIPVRVILTGEVLDLVAAAPAPAK